MHTTRGNRPFAESRKNCPPPRANKHVQEGGGDERRGLTSFGSITIENVAGGRRAHTRFRPAADPPPRARAWRTLGRPRPQGWRCGSGGNDAPDRLVGDCVALNAGGAAGQRERRLDEAVLAAVKADDRRASARLQHGRQHAQQLLQARQFAVDENAQRLERARGGVQVPLARRRVQPPSLLAAGRFQQEDLADVGRPASAGHQPRPPPAVPRGGSGIRLVAEGRAGWRRFPAISSPALRRADRPPCGPCACRAGRRRNIMGKSRVRRRPPASTTCRRSASTTSTASIFSAARQRGQGGESGVLEGRKDSPRRPGVRGARRAGFPGRGRGRSACRSGRRGAAARRRGRPRRWCNRRRRRPRPGRGPSAPRRAGRGGVRRAACCVVGFSSAAFPSSPRTSPMGVSR